jgi:proline iminopeptidase
VLVIERVVATDDGARLWTVADGSGPTLVLCHGGPGLWDYLAPVSSMLRDSARVVRWDQRGCGRSSAASVHSVSRAIEDLEAIREAFGVETWIVGGHSWGASLALQYALRHPERTFALLYISGTGIGQAWNRAYHLEADRRRTRAERDRLRALKARTRTPPEESEYRLLSWLPDVGSGRNAADLIAQLDAPFEINIAANRQISAETKMWAEDDLVARCRMTTVPTLLVHGERDPRPPWAIDSLAAALPNRSVEILPGVGHLPWLEDPEPFARLLRSFLSGLARRSRPRPAQ